MGTKLFSLFLFHSLFFIPLFSQLQQFSSPIRIEGFDYTEESAPLYDRRTKQLFFVRTFMRSSASTNQIDQESWFGNFESPYNTIKQPSQFDFIKKKQNQVICGISEDGKRVYCYHSKDKKGSSAGLYVYDRIQNRLENPKEINIQGLEMKGRNIGFFMHRDEKTLLISYQSENSIGEEDLYLSTYYDNKWTIPVSLGDKINTTGYEISPYLSDNKDTLYFASNGRTDSYGSSDIYFSVKSKNNDWSIPQNLGPTINTNHFEAYLIPIEKGFLWSSNKDGDYADLYFSEQMPNQSLQIEFTKKDVTTFQGFNGEIELTIKSGYPPYTFEWSTGGISKDLFQLRAGKYSVQVTDAKKQTANLTIQITQPELPLDGVLHFPQIQYKRDSWEFINDSTCSSYDSLNQIVTILNRYPTMVLKLISHTDAHGPQNKNLALSQNRSRACYRYLVLEKGIDPRRIIPEGFGESSPAFYMDPSTSKKVLLTEEYVSQITNNQHLLDHLNQLNRRTEGVIDRMNFSNIDPKAPESYLFFLKLP